MFTIDDPDAFLRSLKEGKLSFVLEIEELGASFENIDGTWHRLNDDGTWHRLNDDETPDRPATDDEMKLIDKMVGFIEAKMRHSPGVS